MKNLMLISEGTFVKKEWSRSTQTYLDYFDEFAKAFGIEMSYDDIYRLGEFGVIDFWANFNKGEDGKIDMKVGILRMQIDTDINYLDEDDKAKAQELIDKYGLKDDCGGLLIKQVEKVQDFIVYWYKRLY